MFPNAVWHSNLSPHFLISFIFVFSKILSWFDEFKINAKDKEQFPLIILSGMNFNDDITKGLSMGANQFLTKPVVMERLYTAVTEELTRLVQTGNKQLP